VGQLSRSTIFYHLTSDIMVSDKDADVGFHTAVFHPPVKWLADDSDRDRLGFLFDGEIQIGLAALLDRGSDIYSFPGRPSPVECFPDLVIPAGIPASPDLSIRLYVNAGILGLTAGLSEESFRYIVLRWWAKDARRWRDVVLYGAGHGGVEAIILGGLVIYTFFSIFSIRGIDLATLYTGSELALAEQQVNLLLVTGLVRTSGWGTRKVIDNPGAHRHGINGSAGIYP
jgi:hypothetical protein